MCNRIARTAVTGSYEPDFLRAQLKRFRGSIQAMEDYARSRPGYGDEIREIDAELTRMLFVPAEEIFDSERSA